MEDEEGVRENKYPDMLDLLFYFEQANVGLPRNEMVLLNLSIRKLASTMPLENIRYTISFDSNLSSGAHTRNQTVPRCSLQRKRRPLKRGAPCNSPILPRVSGFGVRYSVDLGIITWWRLNCRRLSSLKGWRYSVRILRFICRSHSPCFLPPSLSCFSRTI